MLYHNPKPDIMGNHLQFLKKHFNFITLDTVVDAIYTEDWSLIPKNSIVITIDDGFKDNFKLQNIFKKYEVTPTIYICSHIVNTNRKFWFEAGMEDPHVYFHDDHVELLNNLSENYGFEPTKEYPARQALDIKEIVEMTPHVNFQSHTKFHPLLSKCSDVESFSEIQESKDRLTEMLNNQIPHFSYPVGNYTDREVQYAKKAGYKSARTCDLGWNTMHTDPFRLKAMGIDDNASINEFLSQLYGIAGFIRFAKQGSFTGKHPQFP